MNFALPGRFVYNRVSNGMADFAVAARRIIREVQQMGKGKGAGHKKPSGKGRVLALFVLCTVVFGIFVVRLAYLQFLRADYYADKVAQASSTRHTVTLPAARGDITDRDGTLLAQDTTVYDLSLCLPAPPGTQLEQTLQTLQELQILDPETGGKDVETQLAAFFDAVSAGELPLAEGLTGAQAAALYESGLPQSGAVRLVARGSRSWADGDLLPHTLGFPGPITAEQWAADDYALQRDGVSMDAWIGQSGLELAYDELLRGKDGSMTVTTGLDGTRLEETLRTEPQPGATLVLCLDAELQQLVQTALANQMELLRTTRGEGQGREVSAGAAVVVDVQTGGILAAVSLPGYDLNRYRADYSLLSSDPAVPLMDRAATGQYAPGSAFKPAVAASALAAGLITPEDTVNCTGTYTYYAGYQPGCLQLGHRGLVNLATALQYSCNIYFYDVGRRLGVDVFSTTAQLLGLGTSTGVELPEAQGRLTWTTDENYQAGLALQAAIGQGNTAVTPLQLAAYAAALANNGARPALHFADKAVDADGKTVWQYSPQILSTAPGGEAVFNSIRQGMVLMSQTLSALRGAPVTVACKTGSPQRPETLPDGSHYTNSVLIGYAPAEAPQIAVAVVLEQGGGGANAAPVLRAILDAQELWQGD